MSKQYEEKEERNKGRERGVKRNKAIHRHANALNKQGESPKKESGERLLHIANYRNPLQSLSLPLVSFPRVRRKKNNN
jgi:hypothetical protein